MTTLQRLAGENRVRITRVPGDGCENGDDRVQGKFGHLFQDGHKVRMVYTDDEGRRTTHKSKNNALVKVQAYVLGEVDDYDQEFMATLKTTPEAFAMACRVLAVKHFKRTKGVPRATPGLDAYRVSKKGSCGT